MHFGQIFAQSAFYYSHIGPYSNEPNDLIEHENGYLVVGYNSLGGPEGNGFLMMLDKKGDVLWEKIEEAPEPDKYEKYIAGTFHNGYFYVGGYRWLNNQRRNLLLKVNPISGNIIWKKVFGELPVLGGDNHIQDIHPNEEGLLIAASGFDSTSMSTVAEFIQIDLEANVLWKKIYSADLTETKYSDRLSKIESMEEGYLLTMDSRDVPEWQVDKYIIKVDKNGNEIWRKNMSGYQSSSLAPSDSLFVFQSATPYKSNHIVSFFLIVNITDSTYTENQVLIEFDEYGNEIDYVKFQEKSAFPFSDIFVNNNSEIFVLSQQELDSPFYTQLYAAKFNLDKELVWEKDYGEKDITEFYFCGTLTSDGGVLIGGRDLLYEPGNIRFYSILVKTDCEGNTDWNYESCFNPNFDEVTLFPNPFSNQINIHIPNIPENNEIKVKIFNSIGRLVTNEIFYDSQAIQLNVGNYAKGIYYCSIELNGKIIANKKLVKAN